MANDVDSKSKAAKEEGGIFETIKVVVQALLIALVIRTLLFQPFNIPSGSLIPTLLIGDYNVMPTDLDVYAPERWRDDALFRPEVRKAYADLVAQGWTDAIRHLHPDERLYTFWKYWRNSFERDAGLRIDHLLLSPTLAPWLRAASVRRGPRGWDHTSDHAPVMIEIEPPSD